ncbi:Dihydrofolate reductase [Lentibacillus sp. JNUCC-1]|uniref:dihydrofolate reductase n=1 Tax=Lentibacillus sp. JNUCC-1 TaxID=2654513 RepID=UPI0012E826D6|nr:dihydrofolate reductase [Lentibacillus sp. JNUCC-1]MUV39824.1 Dihydrofolate reductase [Lentibacillus sp. JNUCC-1]
MISLLVAMDRNRVIGYQNGMPWHLPEDLKFFKRLTTGHMIVMGRKTFDSIGRALPNRENVVLTRGTVDTNENIKVIHGLDQVQTWHDEDPEKEIFVIGGGHIFEQVLPFADRMYITLIEDEFTGDTYFPEFNEANWKVSSRVKGEKNNDNPYDYYFIQYDRNKH